MSLPVYGPFSGIGDQLLLKASNPDPEVQLARLRQQQSVEMPLDLDKFIRNHLTNKYTHGDKNMKYKMQDVLDLCALAKKTLEDEPSLARMNPPCLIVGDIHGQFNDLIRLFSSVKRSVAAGAPPAGIDKGIAGAVQQKMIFLGDYIDRGRHSLECICLVLALKCRFPDKYQLLRGNHEVRSINRDYGFWDELTDRFGEEKAETLWEELNQVFAFMPLAGLVGGKILCMHGGISPELAGLDAIEAIKRPLDDPQDNPLAMDLLWADPMQNIQGFKENTVRGVSVFFGEDAVHDVCKRLEVDLIVRAHQMMLTGFGFFAGRKLVTIFTAPRYQIDQVNLGAVMSVREDGNVRFLTLRPPATEVKDEDKGVDFDSGSCFAGREEEGTLLMAAKKRMKDKAKAEKKAKAAKAGSKSVPKSKSGTK